MVKTACSSLGLREVILCQEDFEKREIHIMGAKVQGAKVP